MLLTLHPDNPEPRKVQLIQQCLQQGGVVIYPTDTIYGLGCDIFQPKAVERICRIKQVQPAKAQLSFICHDLSSLSAYARQLPNTTYRLLKEHLPGPYTFILPASRQVPRILQSKKHSIGLRVPDNTIARTIVKELGRPILSASLPGELVEHYTDPEIIHGQVGHLVDMVVDGGIGGIVPSTIIDCTGDEPVLLRKGAGAWKG
ncbi:MAG TPA: L-threonylcarbamoyladenylate synthase [Chitinophagaceae bacterium]|nr:L-threonylcarbamoyladenylate synthase [Chitinophagaceae bacterium]